MATSLGTMGGQDVVGRGMVSMRWDVCPTQCIAFTTVHLPLVTHLRESRQAQREVTINDDSARADQHSLRLSAECPDAAVTPAAAAAASADPLARSSRLCYFK